MRALLIGPENPHFAGHLRTLQALPEVEAITVCAAPGERALAEEALGAQKVDAISDDLGACLAAPGLGFIIASPRVDRALALTGRALDVGVSVLAEKPLGRNAAEADALVARAKASGAPLGIAYLNRFNPAVAAARDFVAQGLLGDLMAVELRYFTTQPRFRDPAHWLFRKSIAGGGVLQWLGCHYLDIAQFVTGEAITALQGALATRSGEPIDVEDVATVQLRFASGAIGSLACGYVLAQSGGGYYNPGGNDTYLCFVGRLGRVWWRPAQTPLTVSFESVHPAWADAPRRTVSYELPDSPAYGGTFGIAFTRRCLLGQPPATGEDAARVAHLLEGVYNA